eukprot:10584286-Karenia_brevis.AAC.1
MDRLSAHVGVVVAHCLALREGPVSRATNAGSESARQTNKGCGHGVPRAFVPLFDPTSPSFGQVVFSLFGS